MSSGKPTDWEDTKKQMISPCPVLGNETWLGHRIMKKNGSHYQAAKIDLMVLEGISTINEIAREINNTVKRVEDHLEHLQDGDSRNTKSNMKPHKLRIVKSVDGKVKFNLD